MERTSAEAVAALQQDLAEPEAAAELAALVAALDTYVVPEPPPGSTAALVERMRAYMPVAPTRDARRFRTDGLVTAPVPMLIGVFRAQVRLLRPSWWIITTLAALLCPAIVGMTGLAIGLLAPPLAVAAIAYAFREIGSPAMEIEFSCPVSPAHVLAARMLMVQTWVVLLGTVPAAVLQLAGRPVGLWPAFTLWTAGMLLFGGVALALTLWIGPLPGLGVGLALWAGILTYTQITQVPVQPWIIGNGLAAGVGLFCSAAAILSAGRLRRPTGKEA